MLWFLFLLSGFLCVGITFGFSGGCSLMGVQRSFYSGEHMQVIPIPMTDR